MLTDPMNWFQVGMANAPMAGLGHAIKGLLAQHDELTKLAGGRAFESMMPKERAQTEYYTQLAESIKTGGHWGAILNGQEVPIGTPGAENYYFPAKGGTPVKTDRPLTGQDKAQAEMDRLRELVEKGVLNPEEATAAAKASQYVRGKTESGFGEQFDTAVLPPRGSEYQWKVGGGFAPTPTGLGVASTALGRAFGGGGGTNILTPYAQRKIQETGVMNQFRAAPIGGGRVSAATPTTTAGMGQFNKPTTQQFNSTEEADRSGLPAGTIVMVLNPATGKMQRYQI